MLLRPLRVLLPMLALLAALPAMATTFAVPGEFATIQGAIDAAPQSGTQIKVAPGRYVENLVIYGKSVQLVSTGGAGSTVIDGGRRNAVIAITGTGKEQVSVVGFTLTNGYNALGDLGATGGGGGIQVYLAKAVIEDNLIEGNAACFGAGIFSQEAVLVVRRNVISANLQQSCSGANGGGIMMNGSEKGGSVIADNRIIGHQIGGYGGGIEINAVKDVTISGNVINDNQAVDLGGGLFINNSSVELARNQIDNNAATAAGSSGGGVAVINSDKSNRVDMTENVLRGNTAEYGSAVMLLASYNNGIRFTKNVVSGNTAGPLIRCEALPVKVSKNNNLTNSAGPEVGGSCLR